MTCFKAVAMFETIVLLLIICLVAATTIQSARLWLRSLILQKRQQQKRSGKKHCSSHWYLQVTNSFLRCDMADDSLIETTSPQSKRVSRAQGLYGSACPHQLDIIMSMSFAFVDGLNNGCCISLFGEQHVDCSCL